MPRVAAHTTRAIIIASTISIWALTASAAYADDPLAQIKGVMENDHAKNCRNFSRLSYNKSLETIAQTYARTERTPSKPAGFDSIMPFLGAGDPEAQAITRAYEHGAGKWVNKCDTVAPLEYGVGFIRHDDRSVDVVTIVFGVLTPPKGNPNAPRPPDPK